MIYFINFKSSNIICASFEFALCLASTLCGGGGVPYALAPLDPKSVGPHFPTFVAPYLLLGDARDAANARLLLRLGVTHILNVAAGTPPVHEADFIYLHLPLQDTPEQPLLAFFPAAVAFIMDARDAGGVVLVHCQMGISRSVACVLAFLTFPAGCDMTLERAWTFLHRRRVQALPNVGFRTQLALFEIAERRQCSVLHLEKIDAFWDTREWRTHPDRVREIGQEEERAKVLKAMKWQDRAKLAVINLFRSLLSLLKLRG